MKLTTPLVALVALFTVTTAKPDKPDYCEEAKGRCDTVKKHTLSNVWLIGAVYVCKNRRWVKQEECPKDDVCMERGDTAYCTWHLDWHKGCESDWICRDDGNPRTSGFDWRTKTNGGSKPLPTARAIAATSDEASPTADSTTSQQGH